MYKGIDTYSLVQSAYVHIPVSPKTSEHILNFHVPTRATTHVPKCNRPHMGPDHRLHTHTHCVFLHTYQGTPVPTRTCSRRPRGMFLYPRTAHTSGTHTCRRAGPASVRSAGHSGDAGDSRPETRRRLFPAHQSAEEPDPQNPGLH